MLKTVEQKVLKQIISNKLIISGDNILIALSGGADSVFLFFFLNKFKRRLQINIGCFHLNHNLRGNESNNDEKFCIDLATQNKIEFFSSSKNIKLFSKRNGISLEEAGRIIRYRELEECARKNNYNKIATAHHLNDNAETVLLNIIKGAGLKGLAGIPMKRKNIIRPLLCLSKEEIIKYLDNKKIHYRIDNSNLENDYQRNYLRNEIIPLIKKNLNPQFDNAVFRMTSVVKNLSMLIEQKIENAISSAVVYKNKQMKVKLHQLKELEPGFYGELLKQVVNKYFGKELEHQNVDDLIKLINNQVGKKIQLKGKLIAVKERDYLLIIPEDNNDKKKVSVSLKPGECKKIGNHSISISEVNKSLVTYKHSSNIEFVSGDKFKNNLLVRKWQSGDRFYPLGMKNAKKVSDFLNEQKIEAFRKKENLVLINSGNIVWVVGLRIDDRYRITEKTKKVLKLCLN